MHIIAGQFRNRNLITPKGNDVRPTSARLREAVFNICQGYVEETRFLDLFAGSGAMGFEALSRGAKHVTFVDNSKESIRCIQRNVELLGVQNQTRVLYGDVFHWIERLTKSNTTFDIIFSDPPYYPFPKGESKEISFGQRLLNSLDEVSLLIEGGTLFVEEANSAFEERTHLKTLVLTSQREMGRSLLLEYRKIA